MFSFLEFMVGKLFGNVLTQFSFFVFILVRDLGYIGVHTSTLPRTYARRLHIYTHTHTHTLHYAFTISLQLQQYNNTEFIGEQNAKRENET